MGSRHSTGIAGVIFTDLVGSTDLMARVGQDAFDDLRRQHFTRLNGAAAQNGGRQVKTLGDGVMVVFHSASEAVACAVAMQQTVELQARRCGVPLAIRVGVAVGEVTFEDDDVFGVPVVQAARLVAVAAGGQILVTQAVRLMADGSWARSFIEVGLRSLKGLADEVLAFELAWEPSAGSSVPLPALLTDVGPIFVGRTTEFQLLRRAWDETKGQGLPVVLVAGEPGVGKTRLAAELAGQVHGEGAMVLAGRCDEDLAVPFQLFVEPLRHFADHTPDDQLPALLGRFGGELVRLAPELAERVPGLPQPIASDPETERYRVFDAVAAWLAEISRRHPLLLVFDDLHWAAKPNLLLLRHILRAAMPGRMLVVGTYRDTDLSYGHPLVELMADLRRGATMSQVVLGGLSPEGVIAYLEELVGRSLEENELAVAQAIHSHTQGNPFFVREVLRHLADTGAVAQREGRWYARLPVEELGIPQGVREVVRRRLTRLSETCNHVLQVATVMGLEFEPTVLGAAADLDEEHVVTALEESIAGRLVAESSTRGLRYRFTHSLVRDTIYGELSTARRAMLHRRVAQAVASVYAGRLDDQLPALAHHYANATVPLGAGKEAVAFACEAGERALVQLAHHDAVRFYEQALEFLEVQEGEPDVGQRLEILIRLGEAQRRAGDRDHRETLIAACRLAHDHGDAEAMATAALANSRGMFAVIGAVDDERTAMLAAAIEAQGDRETTVRARLTANLATEVVYAEDQTRRYRLSAEALAMARRLGEPGTLAHTLLARVVAIWGPGTVHERLEATEELLALATQLDDAVLVCSGCWHRFVAAMEAGEVAIADRCLDRAERLADDLGQPTMRWLTLILRANRLLSVGLIRESEQVATIGFELGQSAGHPDAFLYYGIHLFNTRYETGHLSEIADNVIRIADANPGVLSIRATLALLYSETGQPDKARAALDSVVDKLAGAPLEASWPRAVTQAAQTCAQLKDRDRASALLDLLVPYAGQTVCTGLSWSGSFDHFIGMLESVMGRLDAAEKSLIRGESAHAGVPAPLWLARSRLERAKVLLARQAPQCTEQAGGLLNDVLDTARQYGLGAVERSAAELLRTISSPA